MIDFAKIYCNLHPHELITNFCSKDECLVGLCANCVCTHTQLHISKGTAPEYQNIRMTYKKIQQNIRNQVQVFQKDKDRIDKINAKVIEKRQKVKEIMELAKEEVSILLGTYFDEKQKNMLRQIQAQQKKYGLHCQNRLQSLNSYISRQVSNLVAAAQQLTSNNFLQSLPRIRTQYLVNSAKLHSQIQQQVIQNQKFSTTISCNKGLLYTLTDVLEKAITVGFPGQNLNQKLRRQSEIMTRPKSQGRVLEKMMSAQLNSTFSNIPNQIKQRNIQSQVQIISNNQQGSGNTFRNTGQFRRSSYFQSNPLPNQMKLVDKIHKISATGFNNNQNIGYPLKPAIQNNYNNNLNLPLNNLNTQQLNSTPTFSEDKQFIPAIVSNTNRINEQSSYRSVQKQPGINSISHNFYNPPLSQMFAASRPQLQKSSASALNKKSRKSGLKLMTMMDGDQSLGHNENEKPWRMETSYM